MRASESAAALRALGQQIDDAVELDEMERLTRALDPPRTPEQPRHERPFVTPSEEETKDLAEPARWAPCPVEQRKWSHSIVVLNPSDLRYGHEPGGRARKEAWKWKRRRWLLAALVVVLVCGGALGYVFGVSSDNKKKRSQSSGGAVLDAVVRAVVIGSCAEALAFTNTVAFSETGQPDGISSHCSFITYQHHYRLIYHHPYRQPHHRRQRRHNIPP